jgi:hypothetical protein
MSRRGFTRACVLVALTGWVVAVDACGSSTSNSVFSPVPSDASVMDGSPTGPGDGPTGHFGGDGGIGNEDASVLSLSFQPASATVTVTGSGTQQASFALQAHYADGSTATVVPESVQFDRPDLATVTDGAPVVATAPSTSSLYGGTGTVHAVYGGRSATATLTVKVDVTDYGAGLSGTSQGVVALNGSGLQNDPAPSISPLLYPYDQTVWPLGLTSPLVMWTAPQVGDVYHLHYSEKYYVFDGYYTLGSLPGQMRLDQASWDRLTASNNATNGADPLTFTLSRWDHVANVAYVTSTQTWTVAPQSLQGAIYYWTASQDAQGVRRGHVSRFQPGTGAMPQPLNNGKCMGCHAVNAQGTTLVADIDDLNSKEYPDGGANTDPSVAPYGNWSWTRAWASFDVSSSSADAGGSPTLETNKFGADLALTPDGTYVVFGGPAPVASGGGSTGSPNVPGSKFISLAPVATGTVIATSGLDDAGVDPGMGIMMPAFSPDGTKLAVVESQYYADNVIPNAAQPDAGVNEYIGYLDFDESVPSFGPTLHKVVDGSNPVFTSGRGLAYPSFTPDSMALAFHAGQYTTGCNANGCDDSSLDDGNLYVTTLTSGTPVRMAAADDPPNPSDLNSSVEPTFNPNTRGGYSWVVFTSMRAWGNEPWPTGVGSGLVNGKRRLWVAAVDPTIGTVDPSHPAIYLEGQEDTPNMRGFWTLASCIATPSSAPDAGATDGGGACTAGFQCCSGFCNNGQCVDITTVACTGVGGSCKATSDCCNAGAVSCTNGQCGFISQ